MAGGHAKFRHLSRDSAHRQSLLRNLVTSLFKHESITTTFAKAKEAQRLAEKLITLGKKNTSASRRRATQIFFEPLSMLPRLLQIAPRYASRPGGCTRVLRLGPTTRDAGERAILSLVDGPRDARMFLTAQTVARDRAHDLDPTVITARNIKKCTNEAVAGEGAGTRFEELVAWYERMEEDEGLVMPEPERNLWGPGRSDSVCYPRNGLKEKRFGGRQPVLRGDGRFIGTTI